MLYYPCTSLEYFRLIYIYFLECDKYIYMESLYFGFWEFFTVYTVFLAEREVDSDLSFIEIDIREWCSTRDSRIESHTELSDYHLSLILDDPIIQLGKRSREVRTIEHATTHNVELEWNTMIHREVFSRI
jgi:hypothetical protein